MHGCYSGTSHQEEETLGVPPEGPAAQQAGRCRQECGQQKPQGRVESEHCAAERVGRFLGCNKEKQTREETQQYCRLCVMVYYNGDSGTVLILRPHPSHTFLTCIPKVWPQD